MKRSFSFLPVWSIVIILVLGGCSKQSVESTKGKSLANSSEAASRSNPEVPAYLNGSYIVVFKDAVENVDGEVEQIANNYKVKADYRYKHALKGFAGTLPQSTVDALRNDPRVKYIEQNQEAHIVGTQLNPPSWGLDRSDQRSLPLDASYTYNQTGATVDAYIFDTGIRLTHSDFSGRAVTGFDAITSGGTAADGNGHGTHVSGTVGGTAYGLAKNVRLIAVRVLDNSGSGTYAQVISGLDWAVADHTTKPAVGNMSLGGPVSQALDDAVIRVVADGIVLCVAAGNSAVDASGSSPARVAQAITVGATDINDGFASFSNYGSIVDILAPGVNITSAWYTTNTATNTISGTSMAAPHVAGAAALYLEANPTSTPSQVEAALRSNATPNKISGVPSGTVNLLLYSLIGTAPPPTIPAAPTPSSPTNAATGVVTNPTLSWNASAGAVSYTVQVSTSSTFATFVYNTSGITSTSTNVTGLANNTTYFWRVNATNAAGTSAWSAPWSFTTTVAGTIPLAPFLSSPANGATGIKLPATLSWQASAGATSYVVQVSTSPSFSSFVYNASGTGTSRSISGLSRLSLYYWRVNAVNVYGTSPWSATWSFTTK